jgi:hypothetical protein
MKANGRQNRMAPAVFVHHRKQPASSLVLLLPFLRHVNMRTLALLMFLGFAVLNATRGNDAETMELGFAGSTEFHMIDKGHRQAQVVPEPIAHSRFASSIAGQFLSKIANVFERALTDPALIEYAKEQGVDTSDWPTTPWQDPAHQYLAPNIMDKCNRKEFKNENLYCL